MFTVRQLTSEEMDYVAGGLNANVYAGSTPPDDDGIWDGIVYSGYDTRLGSINGWSFGISYGSSGLGVWATSPTGTDTFHAYSSGANWSTSFGSTTVTFGMSYNASSGYVQVGWSF